MVQGGRGGFANGMPRDPEDGGSGTDRCPGLDGGQATGLRGRGLLRRVSQAVVGVLAFAVLAAAAPASSGPIAPDTTITKAPKPVIHKRSATFAFESDNAAARFRCQVDKTASFNCPSPKKLIELDEGRHTFKVTAYVGAFTGGVLDPTPAKTKFRVVLGD